jgi:hypothetical protein
MFLQQSDHVTRVTRGSVGSGVLCLVRAEALSGESESSRKVDPLRLMLH